MDAVPAAPGPGGYALLDFGDGRKLERFGPLILDRPAPAADGVPRADPGAWAGATARYERGPAGTGSWTGPGLPAEPWTVALDSLVVELRLASSGGVGLFPEQLGRVRWLEDAVVGRRGPRNGVGEPPGGEGAPAVLNLFAHTGLLTLVAARAGARVAHVDSSRPAVAWARRNAGRSGLDRAPIRWLVDDALAFARREARRGRRYDAVILDPPTYGHGPGGGSWRLETGIGDLLAVLAELTAGRPDFLLLTAHAAGLGRDELVAPVAAAFGVEATRTAEVEALTLVAVDGRRLPAGLALCWRLP